MQTWLVILLVFWGLVVLVMACALTKYCVSWFLNRRRVAPPAAEQQP